MFGHSFVGSGAAAEAAAKLGRRFVGSETSTWWAHAARRRAQRVHTLVLEAVA